MDNSAVHALKPSWFGGIHCTVVGFGVHRTKSTHQCLTGFFVGSVKLKFIIRVRDHDYLL